MVVAVTIAIMAIVVATVVLEVTSRTDPSAEFIFTVLDHFVSDESPLEMPDLSGTKKAMEVCSKQTA